jgi:calcineurin-like phosphoesterase family protein
MCIWLVSDTHFGHPNILQYCNRSFLDITEHDDTLIANWNSVVAKTDTVYHLGDFTLAGGQEAEALFSRLNGNIRVLGYPWHHDKRWLKGAIGVNGFTRFFSASGERVWIEPPMVVLEDVITNEDGRGVPATLCHYPMLHFDRSHYGALHFFGHSHNAGERRENCLDVGVDSAYALTGAYRPLRLEECVALIRSWKGETKDE